MGVDDCARIAQCVRAHKQRCARTRPQRRVRGRGDDLPLSVQHKQTVACDSLLLHPTGSNVDDVIRPHAEATPCASAPSQMIELRAQFRNDDTGGLGVLSAAAVAVAAAVAITHSSRTNETNALTSASHNRKVPKNFREKRKIFENIYLIGEKIKLMLSS
jgi:hypothetical protein